MAKVVADDAELDILSHFLLVFIVGAMENDQFIVAPSFYGKFFLFLFRACNILPVGERIGTSGEIVFYAEDRDESLLGVYLFFLLLVSLRLFGLCFFLVLLRCASLLMKLF